MTKKREHRAAAIVDNGGDGRTFTARAVAYDVVDDYNTRFLRGVFNESLERRLPTITWAHDWSEPVGRATAWEERDDGLYITARFSDPEVVPRARQAMSQISDGTLTDVSVGFMRSAWAEQSDGVTDITKGDLDEVAIVLRGAVPRSEVLSLRSASATVDVAVELARRVKAGELTQDEAQAALTLLAADEDSTAPVDSGSAGDGAPEGDGEGSGGDGGDAADIAEALAAADAVLAERSARR